MLARERLHEVYSTLEEFYQGDVASMLQAARADVEIICKANPVADGVNLSCGAVDVAETFTPAHAMARVPLERAAAPYSLAVAEIANRELSERRAGAVAAWLREHFAIAGTRFRDVRGYGEERPRDDLPPGDPAQRRVEIVTFHPPASRGPGDEPAARQPGGTDGDGVVISVPGGGESPDRTPEDEDHEEKKGGGVIVVQ